MGRTVLVNKQTGHTALLFLSSSAHLLGPGLILGAGAPIMMPNDVDMSFLVIGKAQSVHSPAWSSYMSCQPEAGAAVAGVFGSANRGGGVFQGVLLGGLACVEPSAVGVIPPCCCC